MRSPAVFCVVTANVNGVRAAHRRRGLEWLAAADADVLCLQEVRASDEQLLAVLADGALAGYSVAHAPSLSSGRAGVAVLTRAAPVAVRTRGLGTGEGLHGAAEFDGQGRWVEVDLATERGLLTAVSAYVHTGEADTDRQVEKYRFLDAMSARMAELAARSAVGEGEAVITGDLNVAHREEDLKNWKGNLTKSGFLVPERAYFDRWFAGGWTDLGRAHAGDGPGPYTWWSWRGKAFDLDSGWRIDYLLATAGLSERMVKVEVGRAASYAERWSDHAPVTAWFA
jgi:exodeoxyribonuclease-3